MMLQDAETYLMGGVTGRYWWGWSLGIRGKPMGGQERERWRAGSHGGLPGGGEGALGLEGVLLEAPEPQLPPSAKWLFLPQVRLTSPSLGAKRLREREGVVRLCQKLEPEENEPRPPVRGQVQESGTVSGGDPPFGLGGDKVRSLPAGGLGLRPWGGMSSALFPH